MAALMDLINAPMDVLLSGRGKEEDEDSYEADSESGMKNDVIITSCMKYRQWHLE